MTVRTQRLEFPSASGHMLAARLELPAGPIRAYGIFAHCFTCSKDIAAATRISRGLGAQGIAVLRFDFTGIGNSEGDFANTDFSSNVADLVAAADFLRAEYRAPELLVGHSLGGAAVLVADSRIPEVRAVASIAAPSSPDHVEHLFGPDLATIEESGSAEVSLAGRPFRIRREFVEDLRAQRMTKEIAESRSALLVIHSPSDDTVGIDHARHIFEAAKHPKSFVALDGADHLLTRKEDSEYVASLLGAWAGRYLSPSPTAEASGLPAEGDVRVAFEGTGKFTQSVQAGRHSLIADEPPSVGGDDRGPTPYDYLLAGLGACTTMTLRMYADHKKIDLKHVSVDLRHSRIHAKDCEHCDTEKGQVSRIEREVTIEGDLTPEQRTRLLEIADRCPVHRTLTGEIDIQTREASP